MKLRAALPLCLAMSMPLFAQNPNVGTSNINKGYCVRPFSTGPCTFYDDNNDTLFVNVSTATPPVVDVYFADTVSGVPTQTIQCPYPTETTVFDGVGPDGVDVFTSDYKCQGVDSAKGNIPYTLEVKVNFSGPRTSCYGSGRARHCSTTYGISPGGTRTFNE